MSGPVTLEPLDLAALLCSRVCHDLISPTGAIVNGLEVLEEGGDAETKTFALDLIKKSAKTASARLQFCRIAFGAAGSAGAQVDTGDAETMARGFMEDDKTKLTWKVPRALLPKNRVKLLLNMLVIATADDPARRHAHGRSDRRGRDAWASASSRPGSMRASRSRCRRCSRAAPESGTVDAHAIQPFYTGLLARACGARRSVSRPKARRSWWRRSSGRRAPRTPAARRAPSSPAAPATPP